MDSKSRRDLLTDQLNSLSVEKIAQIRKQVASTRLKGHVLVAEALKRCGIKRVFGIAGTPVDQVFSECVRCGIRAIGTRHQQAAVLMAASSNYMAGTLESATVVSAGPAVTNTLTGILVAHDNRWPVMVLGGRRDLFKQGRGYFQELDAVPLFRPVTKWAATVQHSSELMENIFRAFSVAMTGPPGPVYLDLPEDVLEGSALKADLPFPMLPPPAEVDSDTIDRTVGLVKQALRPLLVLGDGIRWSFSLKSLLQLVEGFGIPFITTPLGRGYLPDDHRLCGNEVRRWILSKADLIVMAGAWFDWRFRFGAELAPDARVVLVDAEGSTLARNVQPDQAVAADPGLFLAKLSDALALLSGEDEIRRLTRWRATLEKALADARQPRQSTPKLNGSTLAPRELFREMQNCLPANSIAVLDGNITLAAAQKELVARQAVSWLDPGWNGCIGASIPFAIGAKTALPDRPVIAICSDTGFGLSGMELETAVRNRIPFVVIVANNDGNTGANRQKLYFPPDYPEKFSEFLPRLRYDLLSKALGCHAELVTAPAEIRPALNRAVTSGLPACINVLLDPHAPHPGFW